MSHEGVRNAHCIAAAGFLPGGDAVFGVDTLREVLRE
jgi:hypothetical protein